MPLASIICSSSFVLLLPAPLLVRSGRWSTSGGIKYSLLRLLKIVTAFTVGHSITLLVGGLGWVHLPERPVEMAIGITIIVSAFHAIRPLFPGWEPVLAGGFGLIHGLAFSSAIAPFGFSAWHMMMTILAFNLGIELMQMAAVLAVVPPLIFMANRQWYSVIRIGSAATAVVAATGWIIFGPPA
ncbi:MAG: HupE/UreJ family protein [Chthoniobacteraceae bacterium]